MEYQNLDKAKALLDKKDKDKDENYTLLDKALIDKLRVWHIKALYQSQKKKKKDILDFILAFDSELNKIEDYESKPELELESKML